MNKGETNYRLCDFRFVSVNNLLKFFYWQCLYKKRQAIGCNKLKELKMNAWEKRNLESKIDSQNS